LETVSTGTGPVITYSLSNTIAHVASGGIDDIYAASGGSGSVTVDAQYSNYASVGGTPGTVTTAGSGSNQTTPPDFVDAAGNNFAEAYGSPTIGAGTDDPSADGPLDLAGNPRDIAGRTDIGAYEYIDFPVLASAGASGVTDTAATVAATINPNGVATSYQLNYGTSSSYGSSTGSQTLPAGTSAAPVSFSLSGLAPATTYHFEILATSVGGTITTSDRAFTTDPAPALSAFTQTHARWRAGSAVATFARAGHKPAKTPVGTTFSMLVNDPAAVTISFERVRSGRRGARGTCGAQTKHNRARAKCTYTTPAGTLTDSVPNGTTTLTFDGVLSTGSKLAPGSYRVSASASAFGTTTAPQTLSFTIVKR